MEKGDAMDDRRAWKGATNLWLEAYGHQMDGELHRAVELYQRSIATYPTPEAHTFLAWTMGLDDIFNAPGPIMHVPTATCAVCARKNMPGLGVPAL